MGAKGSAEAAAKLNADNWGHLEVCVGQQVLQVLKNFIGINCEWSDPISMLNRV